MRLPVRILYRNWRGVTAWRRIVPEMITCQETTYHPGYQWTLHAWDLDKKDNRFFSIKDIKKWEEVK